MYVSYISYVSYVSYVKYVSYYVQTLAQRLNNIESIYCFVSSSVLIDLPLNRVTSSFCLIELLHRDPSNVARYQVLLPQCLLWFAFQSLTEVTSSVCSAGFHRNLQYQSFPWIPPDILLFHSTGIMFSGTSMEQINIWLLVEKLKGLGARPCAVSIHPASNSQKTVMFSCCSTIAHKVPPFTLMLPA